MESVNSFNNGMDSDISKFFMSKDKYLQAVNFRAVTELGESGGSLVNIKGNNCAVKFPTMRPTYMLKPNITNSAVTGNTTTITINGQTTSTTLTINSSTTGKDIYNVIVSDLTNCFQNTTVATKTFSVAYKDDYVIISQLPEYLDCTRTDSSAITISRTPSGGAVNLLDFYDYSTLTPSNAQKDYLASYITTNKIIGHTFILDDIYLFTAEDTGTPVNDTYTGPGAIWKLNYSETTAITTLTLMYYSLLDFNKNYPIAPSAATGRYESIPIQRLYWTDFYNKVRTINIADPQIMALHPKLLTLIPSVGFDIPILTSIIGGGLESGTYELCYRLKQSLGAVSSYSQLSFPVNVTAGTINDIIGYEGSTGGSGKGIRWTITNIDTSFDTIEYVVAFRNSYGDIAKIYSVLEEPVPNDGERVIDITTLNDAIDIPLEEFLSINSAFTHAKTVETKDNRLFWGNLKNKSSEINFDARAYRAKTTGTIPGQNDDDVVLTNGGLTTTNTVAYWGNLTNNPKTNDCINNYYDSSGNWSTDACYYKPGALYDANGHPVLGGAGPNISYEFGTYSTILTTFSGGVGNSDDSFNIYGGPDQSPPTPFRDTTNDATNTYTLINTNPPTSITNTASENQVYINGAESSVKYPYLESILRGFQHEEIYRFGIQFFDLAGAPYFTEWIGDIKMPAHNDYNNNPDALAAAHFTTNPRFYSSFQPVSPTAPVYSQTIYIKFTVDVSSVKDIISGYKIVRVDRSNIKDKTILGHGVITPTYAHPVGGNPLNVFLPSCFDNVAGLTDAIFPPLGVNPQFKWWPSADQWSWQSLSLDTGSMDINALNFKTMDCFDFSAGYYPGYTSGDKILVRERIDSINYLASGGANNVGYRKYFNDTEGWFGKQGSGTVPVTFQTLPDRTKAPSLNPYGYAGYPGATYMSAYDTGEMPFWIQMYAVGAAFIDTTNLSSATYGKALTGATWCAGNQSVSLSGGSAYYNYACTYVPNDDHNQRPCYGASTLVLDVSGAGGWDDDFHYGANATNAAKVMALYYRPNTTQYGGNTYNARSQNEYIACGSFIPMNRDNVILDQTGEDNTNLTINVLGGDVYTTYWDHQKAIKGVGELTHPTFTGYNGNNANWPGSTGGITTTYNANNSVTYFIPATTFHNAEVRTGKYINKSLTYGAYSDEDDDTYYSYHSNQSNIVKYFPKPINLVDVTEWVNRVHYSEVKFNNELQDSWQAYKTNNFYDVEGNYGPINCLIALKEQLYYIQERAFGYLYVNPITTISGDNGIPVTLGKGATIEKHQNLVLDVGTKHQWSVYRSQSAITWVDVRSKKIYMFNGSVKSISDSEGQRNFIIKRLHPDLIANDNPILKKGIVTTYDHYQNEFLYTFINDSTTNTNDENYTLAYSEPIGKFTGLYSFVPPIYLNNNRYLFSIDPNAAGADIGKIWIHNFGNYGSFYGTVNDSTLKVLINDNPLQTKVFDNLSWTTQSILDNIMWIDDLITPNANPTTTITDNVNYIDDTFSSMRVYNEWENSDWTTLTLNTNLKKREQNWSVAVPRNKVNYDSLTPPVNIFTPANLTKTDFGERMRDKWMIVDLKYTNTPNRRFIVHTLKTSYRISSR